MEVRDPRLREIWTQDNTPVVFRQKKPPLLLRLPYAPDNYAWLRGSNQRKPVWDGKSKRWETPVAWFDDLIQRSVRRYGRCYVIQPHNEHQKCAAACWNAKGFHCECSCMGENHGSGHPGGEWREISETFAFVWGPRQYACRLITASSI